MVWALRNVFMMIPDSAWEPGGRIDPPPPPQPFDAFRASALNVVCPFRIVRAPVVRPRRAKANLA
jgi:hypothetical protein